MAELLLTGLELTVTGMVTVFILLTLMVWLIGLMSKLAHRLQPPAGPQSPGPPGGAPDSTLVSAITAAVHRYRRERR